MNNLFPIIKILANGISPETIQDQLGKNPLSFADLPEFLNAIFEFAYAFVGLISVALLIYGGYSYLTAAGNEENTKKATKIITGAVIGIILVLAAVAIQYTVINLLEL